MNLVEDFLATADARRLPPVLAAFRPSGTLLLSSRRDTSRYATALLLDSRGRLRIVAKIVRRPHHQERLPTEYEILRLLEDRCANGPAAPLPLGLVQHHGHWLLLQSAVEGTILGRHRLARSPHRMWQRVEEWLLGLPSPTTSVDEAWHAEQIVGPMREIERALPATSDEKRLFEVTQSLTHELASAGIPAPVEHGDLFKGHLVASRGLRLTAIDWELGRPAGLVGADAATFLIDLFRAPAGGLGGEATADAYARHFLDARGVARQWLEAHLRRSGVDPYWVEHILLATWSRRALHIWEPVVSETAEAQPKQRDHARTLFRGFWSLRLWRMTLEQMTR